MHLRRLLLLTKSAKKCHIVCIIEETKYSKEQTMWQIFKSKKRLEQEALRKKQIEDRIDEDDQLRRERDERNRRAFQEMVDFRPVGAKFNLLGVTLIVERVGGSCDYRMAGYPVANITAKYVDKDGVIREQNFYYEHLPMLRAENP